MEITVVRAAHIPLGADLMAGPAAVTPLLAGVHMAAQAAVPEDTVAVEAVDSMVEAAEAEDPMAEGVTADTLGKSQRNSNTDPAFLRQSWTNPEHLSISELGLSACGQQACSPHR